MLEEKETKKKTITEFGPSHSRCKKKKAKEKCTGEEGKYNYRVKQWGGK